MFWDQEHETMPRGELEALQLERLQAKVRDVYEKVPFYRQAFQERGVDPERRPLAGRPGQAALHHQGRLPRQLPLRPVRRAR